MPAKGAGRHCAACQTTVLDFTHQTDAEILAALRRASGKVCGRFGASQLARPLRPAAPASRWRTWLSAALALGGALGAGRAAAQGGFCSGGPTPTFLSPARPPAAPHATGPSPATPPTGAGPDGPALVRGRVTDASTGDGLPGVTILFKGTTQGTSADANGEFTLPLADNKPTAVLTVSFIGYASTELPAAEAMSAAPVTIQLKADYHNLMGEVVIVNYKSPYPWHPRRFFNWTRYQLGRPFRR